MNQRRVAARADRGVARRAVRAALAGEAATDRARDVRRVPLYEPFRAAGAAFGQAAGWERRELVRAGRRGPEGPLRLRGTRRGSPPFARRSGRRGRRVALYDLSTYAKFVVAGAGRARRACNGWRRPTWTSTPGRIVYTLLGNERGGIEMDPTITRLGEDRFLVLAPTLTQRRTEGLLRRGLPAGAVVTDVTSGCATLHVAGPRSRELLARLTDADVSGEAWPFLQAREIEVARARAWAFRVSFTGELGWELSVPDRVRRGPVRARRPRRRRPRVTPGRLVRVRRRARRSVASARGATTSARSIEPFAAGLGFAVSRRKAVDFVGREALERLRVAEPERRLVSVHAPDGVLWHGESMLRDGERVGHVTSASIAPTLGGSAGWLGPWARRRGVVRRDRWRAVPCRVSLEPVLRPARRATPRLTWPGDEPSRSAAGLRCAPRPYATTTAAPCVAGCPDGASHDRFRRPRPIERRNGAPEDPIGHSGTPRSWSFGRNGRHTHRGTQGAQSWLVVAGVLSCGRGAQLWPGCSAVAGVLSCGRGPRSPSGRPRTRPGPGSGGRPCGRSGRRRRSGCGRAGPRATTRRAMSVTRSAVNPNFSKIVPAGADAPKWSSPMIAPSSPTQRSQPSDTPISTLTRLRTDGGSTESR